jgi:two-component system cell cycle sensor histidine kinase/response regulator CckA
MVYAIVKQLGAYIHVDSSPDVGTRFSIYFPVKISTEIAPTTLLKRYRPGSRERKALKQSADSPALILIAEDQPDIQQTMIRYLSKAGYQTEVTSSGVEAIQRFKELNSNSHKPSLLIADLGLPGMDGRTLCRKVKEINPQIPVLLTSGHAIQLDDSKTKTVDGIPFIQKPFDNDTILKMISALLE